MTLCNTSLAHLAAASSNVQPPPEATMHGVGPGTTIGCFRIQTFEPCFSPSQQFRPPMRCHRDSVRMRISAICGVFPFV